MFTKVQKKFLMKSYKGLSFVLSTSTKNNFFYFSYGIILWLQYFITWKPDLFDAMNYFNFIVIKKIIFESDFHLLFENIFSQKSEYSNENFIYSFDREVTTWHINFIELIECLPLIFFISMPHTENKTLKKKLYKIEIR